jgi:excisionase family DNA binding protein
MAVRPAERETYALREVADILGISYGLAYRLCSEGSIPSLRLGDRVLVHRDALRRLLAQAGAGAPFDSNGEPA